MLINVIEYFVKNDMIYKKNQWLKVEVNKNNNISRIYIKYGTKI